MFSRTEPFGGPSVTETPAPTRPRRRHPIARLAGVLARLPRYLNLAQGMVRDPSVPAAGKAALAGGIGYVFSPLDLIPGIIPVLGQLDDLAALLLGLRLALNLSPAETAQAHMDRVGLNRAALDADLRTVAVASVWVVQKTASLGARILGGPLRLITQVARAPRRPTG
jgi:uncharacterized membrane protein YkvA (DUF1232 family)